MKAVDEICGDKDDQCIDDQKKETQGDNGNGQGKDNQYGFHQKVQYTQYYRNYNGRDHGIHANTGQDIGKYDNR